METTNEYLVKFYKGTVHKIAQRYGYTGTKLYKFSLQLKALFPYSYIYQYTSQISFIAKKLNLDVRTVKKRISRLIAHQFACTEGETLRLASNSAIRKHFGVQNYNKKYKTRHRFKWIRLDEINLRVDKQPLDENIRGQKRTIKYKQSENSKKPLVNCQSFSEESKLSPVEAKKRQYVGTPLMSQKKAAQLYGYSSNASGYRLLKRLSAAGCAEIESNRVEITKEEYNWYKRDNCTKLLILGKGLDAKFYYLFANTVNIKREPKPKETGVPYYLSEYW